MESAISETNETLGTVIHTENQTANQQSENAEESSLQHATLKEDVKVVKDVIPKQCKYYYLVPWKEFCRNWKSRSDVYTNHDFLCPSNKKHITSAGLCALHVRWNL